LLAFRQPSRERNFNVSITTGEAVGEDGGQLVVHSSICPKCEEPLVCINPKRNAAATQMKVINSTFIVPVSFRCPLAHLGVNSVNVCLCSCNFTPSLIYLISKKLHFWADCGVCWILPITVQGRRTKKRARPSKDEVIEDMRCLRVKTPKEFRPGEVHPPRKMPKTECAAPLSILLKTLSTTWTDDLAEAKGNYLTQMVVEYPPYPNYRCR